MATLGICVLLFIIIVIIYNSFGFRLEHSDPVFKKITYREYEVDFKKEKPANIFAGKQEGNVLSIFLCCLS